MRAVGPWARRLAAVLGPVLVVVGLIGTAVGVGLGVAATRDVSGEVAVPMRLTASDGLGAGLTLTLGEESFSGGWVSGVSTLALPDRDFHSFPLGTVEVHVPDASPVEQVLSRADVLLRGIALLVAGLALRPVLRSIAEGRPFRPDHERRLRVVAGCVVVGAYVAPMLPWWASASVLARFDGVRAMSAAPPHHVEAFVVAGLVLLVGAVVRAGATEPHVTTAPVTVDLEGLERRSGSHQPGPPS